MGSNAGVKQERTNWSKTETNNFETLMLEYLAEDPTRREQSDHPRWEVFTTQLNNRFSIVKTIEQCSGQWKKWLQRDLLRGKVQPSEEELARAYIASNDPRFIKDGKIQWWMIQEDLLPLRQRDAIKNWKVKACWKNISTTNHFVLNGYTVDRFNAEDKAKAALAASNATASQGTSTPLESLGTSLATFAVAPTASQVTMNGLAALHVPSTGVDTLMTDVSNILAVEMEIDGNACRKRTASQAMLFHAEEQEEQIPVLYTGATNTVANALQPQPLHVSINTKAFAATTARPFKKQCMTVDTVVEYIGIENIPPAFSFNAISDSPGAVRASTATKKRSNRQQQQQQQQPPVETFAPIPPVTQDVYEDEVIYDVSLEDVSAFARFANLPQDVKELDKQAGGHKKAFKGYIGVDEDTATMKAKQPLVYDMVPHLPLGVQALAGQSACTINIDDSISIEDWVIDGLMTTPIDTKIMASDLDCDPFYAAVYGCGVEFSALL